MARRQSFTMATHTHTRIPTSVNSHPNNPIPTEPVTLPILSKRRMSSETKRSYQSTQSARSSGESLAWSEATSDTEDMSTSTPPSEPADKADATSAIAPESEDKDEIYVSTVPRENKEVDRPRRVSTNLVTSGAEDIQEILGKEGSGTKFLQKYCCGGGCCKVADLQPARADFVPIVLPDNDAFRGLELKPRVAPLTLDTQLTQITDLPQPKYSFEPLPAEQSKHFTSTIGVHPPEFVQPHPPYRVFSAPVYHARELTNKGAEKRTVHFDIDITDYPKENDVDFKVGGAVGVCPPNDEDMVNDVFDQLGVPKFMRDKPTILKTDGGRWPTIWGDDMAREVPTTRRELLTWCADISSTPPTKQLLRVLAEYAAAENEKKILLYLCSAQGQAAFCDLRTGPHITLQQLLHAFPSSKPPLELVLGQLTQLMPRFYSLSNDPHVSSDREGLAGRRLIEVAVSVHETPNFDGSTRTGIGSGFLERVARQFIDAEKKTQDSNGAVPMPAVHIPMFKGLMANPLSQKFDSDGPMIMVGAGVGMAPFRGFILNRLRNSKCANKIWLIQGVRDSMLDEIYSGELGAHEKDIKKVVQSRVAQPPPVSADELGVEGASAKTVDASKATKVAKYVQDEVRLQADIVWFVINALDGRIFVCGSSKGMGEGVERALIDVAMDKGNLNFEEAKEFWAQKRDGGQYVAETW